MAEDRSSQPADARPRSEGYKPIEDYGVIGDLRTAVLVGKDGSIDWCCLPNFDSPSVFASILDSKKGGFFKIAPVQDAVQKQMYLPETCVLVTRFLSPEGVCEVIDFMPVYGHEGQMSHANQIVRQVRVVRGSVHMKMTCLPAFDYARLKHTVDVGPYGVVFSSGWEELGLTSTVPLRVVGNGVEAEFLMHAGDKITFLLRHTNRGSDTPPLDPEFQGDEAFRQTVQFWRRWVASCKYQGRWREVVQRSALTLKLLTFAPTGAIVAAPTTSLPETIGGVRNWDYRYTWIRDAAFTVYGFLRLGITGSKTALMKRPSTAPCRACMPSAAATSWKRRSSGTWRAIGSPRPSASAMPPTGSASWTSTVSSWTPSTSPTSMASPSPTTCGSISRGCSTT